jgi:adenylate cyclase
MGCGMPIEIERKFLVRGDAWRPLASKRLLFRQGYVSKTPRVSVRVRRFGARATLTVKGRRVGISREEFEYAIAVGEAEAMLDRLCGKSVLEKVRHWVPHAGMTWHVDEYRGAAAGLVLAEIELAYAEQAFPVPDWAGEDVTFDPRYRNSSIARAAWRNPAIPIGTQAPAALTSAR